MTILFIDLPEVVNEATPRSAARRRTVFIVCTPELTSLKMARFPARRAGGPRDSERWDLGSNNRIERGGPPVEIIWKR